MREGRGGVGEKYVRREGGREERRVGGGKEWKGERKGEREEEEGIVCWRKNTSLPQPIVGDYNNNYRGLPSNALKPNSSLWTRGREGIERREGGRGREGRGDRVEGGNRKEGGGRGREGIERREGGRGREGIKRREGGEGWTTEVVREKWTKVN